MNPLRLWKAYRAWTHVKSLWEVFVIKKEPVALGAVIRSAAVLLAVFGFELSVEQIAGLIVVGELVVGVFVRAKLSPVAT